MKGSRRIGLFGGLFDSVHTGHQTIAGRAAAGLNLDRLYLVPAHLPPHKKPPVLAARDRLALLSAVFAGDPRIEVSDAEIARGGISYAYETVEYFKAQTGGDIFFIIGGDNLGQIHRWKYPERIFAAATIAAVFRPGFATLDRFPEWAGKVIALEMPPVDISSTILREKLKKGEAADPWIPKAAMALIREKGWYR